MPVPRVVVRRSGRPGAVAQDGQAWNRAEHGGDRRIRCLRPVPRVFGARIVATRPRQPAPRRSANGSGYTAVARAARDDVAGHGERLRGGLSSTAEHRIVAPKVTGSKPVGHPNSLLNERHPGVACRHPTARSLLHKCCTGPLLLGGEFPVICMAGHARHSDPQTGLSVAVTTSTSVRFGSLGSEGLRETTEWRASGSVRRRLLKIPDRTWNPTAATCPP
jgi:hypothetical protein